MLIGLKVRPEALTRQRIIFVMTGISPKGSTERFTHARIVRFFVALTLQLRKKKNQIFKRDSFYCMIH